MTETLKSLIDELTIPHPRTANGATGMEDPLLVLLEGSVASSAGRGSGGSSSTSPGGVIDAHALDVLTDIKRIVRRDAPSVLPGDTLSGTVRRWHNIVTLWDATEQDTLQLLSLSLGWRMEIRGILEPVKRLPMRGQVCPGCRHDYFQNEAGDWNPVITVEMRSIPVAMCAVCGEQWAGGGLLDLKDGRLAAASN